MKKNDLIMMAREILGNSSHLNDDASCFDTKRKEIEISYELSPDRK
jgi:hypothetical protein